MTFQYNINNQEPASQSKTNKNTIMKNAKYIHKNFDGYGHYKITLTLDDDEELTHTTTDMQAIDRWDDTEGDYEPCGAIILAERTLFKNNRDEDVSLDELKEKFED